MHHKFQNALGKPNHTIKYKINISVNNCKSKNITAIILFVQAIYRYKWRHWSV